MPDRPVVFVDVETTGMGANSSRILEIGALRIEDGKVVATFNQLLDPGVFIPPFITQLTGISEIDTKGKPQFERIANEIESLFDGAVFAAHNVGFDYAFFQSEFKRLGQKFHKDRFCTARLSRLLYPQHRRHNLDSIIERGGYKVKNRHRAYDDAFVLKQFCDDAYKEYKQQFREALIKIMQPAEFANTAPSPQYVPYEF